MSDLHRKLRGAIIILSASFLVVTALQAQRSESGRDRSPVLDRPHLKIDAAFVRSSGSSCLTMSRWSDHVIERSLADGQVLARYEMGAPSKIHAILDFALDPTGRVHLLLASRDRQRPLLVRRFDSDGATSRVAIDSRGMKLRVDPDGNYVLLGYSTSARAELKNYASLGKPMTMQSLDLIHKFSPTGEFLESYFPIPAPADLDEAEVYFKGFPSLSKLEILDSGEMFLLLRRGGKGGTRSLQSRIFRIRPAGGVEELPLVPPFEDTYPTDLHRVSANDVAVEWLTHGGRGRLELRSVLEGRTLLSLDDTRLKKVLACDRGKVVMMEWVGGGDPKGGRLVRGIEVYSRQIEPRMRETGTRRPRE